MKYYDINYPFIPIFTIIFLEPYVKPNRPCLFCGKAQAKLKRHILGKHKGHPRVVPLLKMDQKEVDATIDIFRNEAILVHNKHMIQQGSTDILRKRKSKIEKELPVLCTGCKGFFSKSYKSKHQKVCPSTMATAMMMPIINLSEETSATTDLPEGFKKLLNTLHLDIVSDKIKNDVIILMIGCRYFKSLERKKDKQLETTKYVRSRLRLTARLYITYEENLRKNSFVLEDPENNSADLFRREAITILGE